VTDARLRDPKPSAPRGTDFSRKFVRRLAHNGPTFSTVGASGNPGAVHYVG
jgi:hypothetical protein